MPKLIFISLVSFTSILFGQKTIIDSEILSVKCDENIDAYRINTILTKDSISSGMRIVHFTTSATCCVNFRIKSTFLNNIVRMELQEYGEECDCICSYDFVVRFNTVFDSNTKFFANKRELRTDVPKIRPYKKRYFVFENDTTGFDDENGLRQGYTVHKRKNNLHKVYYKDGKFIKLEITDLKGRILATEKEEGKIFEY